MIEVDLQSTDKMYFAICMVHWFIAYSKSVVQLLVLNVYNANKNNVKDIFMSIITSTWCQIPAVPGIMEIAH